MARRVLSRMLQEIGIEVVSATGAADGIEFLAHDRGRVDAVVLDARTLVADREYVDRLQGISRDVRAVVLCGPAEAACLNAVAKTRPVWPVEKPYTITALAKALQAALEAKAAHIG